MIDKNGKLLGKINIIDLFFIIIVLAAAAFALFKLGVISPDKTAANPQQKILLTMYQEEVNTFTTSNVKIGDPVSESFQNINFGKVVDIEIEDSISWGADQSGNQIKTKKDGFSSITLTMETPGKAGPSGLTIGGAKYYVGQLLVIRAGTSTFYARVEGAEQINE